MLFPMPSDYALLLQASLFHHTTRNPAISALHCRGQSQSQGAVQNIKAAHEEEEPARFCTSTHPTQSPTVASVGLVSTAAASQWSIQNSRGLLRAVVLEWNAILVLSPKRKLGSQTFSNSFPGSSKLLLPQPTTNPSR